MRRFQLVLYLCLGVALVAFALQIGCDLVQDMVLYTVGGAQYTQAQIDRGRYLVEEVAQCGSGCHTPIGPTGPDPNRILAGGQEFIPGALSSPNITPDTETGIGNYTDEQIFKAITQGVGHFDKNPNGEPLFPIMPYWIFANMTPDDVMAIIAFLRTEVEPVRNEVPERAPFIIPPQAVPALDYSSLLGDNADPGKYLTSAAGLCINCHTPQLEGGGLDSGKFFAGGVEFNIPGFKVASQNITSEPETGIGNWTREEIINALQNGTNNEGIPLCPPMPQFRGLTEKDLNDIVNFVMNLPPINNFVEPCELVEGPPPGGPPSGQ